MEWIGLEVARKERGKEEMQEGIKREGEVARKGGIKALTEEKKEGVKERSKEGKKGTKVGRNEYLRGW